MREYKLSKGETAGNGDTGEFVVLTNLDATAKLDLSDARLVAWISAPQSARRNNIHAI